MCLGCSNFQKCKKNVLICPILINKGKPTTLKQMEKELEKIAQLEEAIIHSILMEKRVPKGFFKNKLKEHILDLKKSLRELEEKNNIKHLFIKL
jgi:hypothetical protein